MVAEIDPISEFVNGLKHQGPILGPMDAQHSLVRRGDILSPDKGLHGEREEDELNKGSIVREFNRQCNALPHKAHIRKI
jgi:hypothetical protein